ncbi:unnamed protein product [Symbiodinium microadriaticum]|nr:unnamed protein product [Symbiodinium microadriaticum]CAE7922296.1 unnamed protein product [Symbiodinium sp. KB8]
MATCRLLPMLRRSLAASAGRFRLCSSLASPAKAPSTSSPCREDFVAAPILEASSVRKFQLAEVDWFTCRSLLLARVHELPSTRVEQGEAAREEDLIECANRSPMARIPKPANKGCRPRGLVMRKMRKRVRTGR